MRVRTVFTSTALAAAALGSTLAGPAQAAGGTLDYNVQVNVVEAGGHLSVFAINLTNGTRCNVGAHPCVKAVVHRDKHHRKSVQFVAPSGTVFRPDESYWGYSSKDGSSQNVMPWSTHAKLFLTNKLVRPDNHCVPGELWGQIAAYVKSIPQVSDSQRPSANAGTTAQV